MGSAVSVYLSGDQAIANSVQEQLEFDTEVYDTLGEFDTATYRFTATVAGKYLVSFQAKFAGGAGGEYCEVILRKNTTEVAQVRMATPDANMLTVAGSITVNLAVDDYIEADVENHDNSDTIQGGQRYETFMTITRVQ